MNTPDPVPEVQPPQHNVQAEELPESPPKKKLKSMSSLQQTLIHDDVQPDEALIPDVQPPRLEVQSDEAKSTSPIPDVQSPLLQVQQPPHLEVLSEEASLEQTPVPDVQLQQLDVQSEQQTPAPDVQLQQLDVQSEEASLEQTPVPDVQLQQLDVQSEQALLQQTQVPDVQLQQLDVQSEEASPEQTPISEVQLQQLEVQSEGQTPISDVQLLQLDVQSEELELPSSEQDLSQQGDELTLTTPEEMATPLTASKSSSKKSKKKSKNINNVWTRPTSRKGKKKAKSNQNNGSNTATAPPEERVFISPVPKFPDKNDDNSEISICLSKFYKAEKVEISEDRLSAGSTKGYRMVRATRGVVEGAWYFEIKVMHLGETGHTRLGWSTEKGDLQAPVGFDGNSFGYRDIDGSKVHKALREKYGEGGYGEGDVLGFYINLPDGDLFEPKPPRYVWFKGQRYVCAPDANEDPPKVVPGSEICFFKNGICQGTAFTDLFGGRYYPAASMYTLPNQSNCLVRFNFGPVFDNFPEDFGGRPAPRPMTEVAYYGCDGRVENGNGSLWNSTRTSSMLKVTKEQGTLFVEASEIDID